MFNSSVKSLLSVLESSIARFDSSVGSTIPSSVDSLVQSHFNFYQEIYPHIRDIIKHQEKHIPSSSVPDLSLLSGWIAREAPESLINDKFTFTASESAVLGQGVVATRDLGDGEQFLSIPRRLMLTTDNARTSELGPIFSSDSLISRFPSLMLVMFLLYEKSKGTDSYWYPYIQSLPSFDSFRLPMLLEPSELHQLQHSPTLLESCNLIRATIRQYIHLYKVLKKNGFFSDSRKPVFRFSFNEFRWAVAILMSRQNRIPSTLPSPANANQPSAGPSFAIALIPGWDLCNHTGNGEIRTYMNAERDASESFTLHSVKAGEPIHLFYGQRGNPKLFLYSGFVDPSNQYDYYDYFLTIPTLNHDNPDRESIKKIQSLLLKRSGGNGGDTQSFALPLPKMKLEFPEEKKSHGADAAGDAASESEKREKERKQREEEIQSNEARYQSLLSFCRIATLNKSDAATALKQKSRYVERISDEHEVKAMQFLEQSLVQLLKSYGSTAEEDEETLKELEAKRFNKDEDRRVRVSANRVSLCVEMRIIEKRMIATAIATVKQWIQEEQKTKAK